MDARLLKGDPFVNRIRISGKLTTASPLHIGTGASRPYDDNGEERKITTILTDHRGKPLIPGSTLRGVMRHWLLHTLHGVNHQWATMSDHAELLEQPQSKQIESVRNDFSWLELLFGTPFNAGKIEVWDATCKTGDLENPDTLLQWDGKKLIYVDTSVVIDPETGTARDQLLYKSEIVPPGVEFELNITGQNLADTEIGLILLALKGFNSEIYPIRVGARSGRGYGRMKFTLEHVYLLDREGVQAWIESLLESLDKEGASDTGYYALPKLTKKRQVELLQQAKKALKTAMKER